MTSTRRQRRRFLRVAASSNTLTGNTAANTLFGGGGTDTFVIGPALGGADLVLDFQSGADHLLLRDGLNDLNIGNGDHQIDSQTGLNKSGFPLFVYEYEITNITQNIIDGAITTASAAEVVNWSRGWQWNQQGNPSIYFNNEVFVVSNGQDTALFEYHKTQDPSVFHVDANDLTLLAILQGAAHITAADYLFG